MEVERIGGLESLGSGVECRVIWRLILDSCESGCWERWEPRMGGIWSGG